MKKYFAIIISIIVVLTCFTACKPKIKDGTLVTDAGGQAYAAVTEADGGIARDDAGNVILLVTDEHGKNVRGDDGKYVTQAVMLDHALVMGNRIECPDFSIAIPDGWRGNSSYADLVLTNNSNSEEMIKVMYTRGKKLSEIMEDTSGIIDTIKTMFSDCVYTNKAVKVCGFDGTLVSAYVPKNTSGTSTYMGYIFFERNSVVYTCLIAGDSNMNDRLDEVLEILNSINFR